MPLARILGISPLARPGGPLVNAINRAGGLGIQPVHRAEDLEGLKGSFGVFLHASIPLPEQATVVVVPAGMDFKAYADRTVLVVVTNIDEAASALSAGANGLIAKGLSLIHI